MAVFGASACIFWLSSCFVPSDTKAPKLALTTIFTTLIPAWIHSIAWPKVGTFFQALLTILIAVIALLIQRQQAETNRLQRRFAVFERRMRVFDATTILIGEVFRDGAVNLEQLFAFLRGIRESELLFGAEIKAYLDEIYKKGNKLRALQAVNLAANAEQITELLDWLCTQRPVVVQKFLPYMDFREP
ncbi:MAG TPA: hypothetical protein VNX88_12885 [Terriglobales bacterium]|nr:hypothetical protein [Terriglobales bacterium]